MFNKPINNIVKEHFVKMRDAAKEKAEKDFKINILDKIEGQEHFKKLKICSDEYKRIKKLKEQDPHPYYRNNGDNRLLTQFANRHFLLNVDETDEFIQSVYLSDYCGLIFEEIDKLTQDIPKFTYKEFLNGVQCKYLENFDSYYNIEKEEYYKVSTWQMNSLLDIVQYDQINAIKSYQEHCKITPNPLTFIANELSILEEELTKTINDASVLKQILSKLYIFKNIDINTYDNKLLLENYPLLFNDKNNFRKLNPINLKEPLNKISNNAKTIVSNEFTLFFVIDTMLKWMKNIINGESINKPYNDIDFSEKINEVKNDAENEFQKEIEAINHFCFNNESITTEQKNEYLRVKFQHEIDTYNNIKDKRIFYFLRDENEKLLLEELRFNHIINNDLDDLLKELKKAYKILNVSWEISEIYFELFENRIMKFNNNTTSYITIQSLMNDMVLDKNIYNELNESMNILFRRMENDSLPLDIHFINHRKLFVRLFEKCISNLQEILNIAEPNNKILYIQTRLKELKQRELKFRTLVDVEKEFKNKEDKYPNLFKEFLSIEADFIKETIQVSPMSYLPKSESKLLIEEEKTFKTFINQGKQDYILKLLEDLSITVGGKSILSSRKKGAIRGVVEALREANIVPQLGLDTLCRMIAGEIDLKLNSKLDESYISKDFKTNAKQYIKRNPFH